MRRRVSLKEAAELLDTTTEAVRKRAKRGTLDSETGDDGLLYVWVDEQVDAAADRVDDRVDGNGQRVDGRVDESFRAALIEHMSSEIEHLREQLALEREANRENRRLLAAALERIPELEAPRETSRSARTPSVDTGKGEVPSEEKPRPTQRSWLHRFFFGP